MIEILQELSQAVSAQSDTAKTIVDTLPTVINATTVDSIAINFRSDAIDSLVSLLAANLKTTNKLISFWVPLLSLVGTVLSVLVGPYIQRKNAREQIQAQLEINRLQNMNFVMQLRANIHTTDRQKWITELRDCISEFMSLISYGEMSTITKSLNEESQLNQSQRLLFLLNKSRLFLNMEDKDHMELFRVLEKAVVDFGERPGSDEKNLQEIMRLSLNIFSRERNRIENFE